MIKIIKLETEALVTNFNTLVKVIRLFIKGHENFSTVNIFIFYEALLTYYN